MSGHELIPRATIEEVVGYRNKAIEAIVNGNPWHETEIESLKRHYPLCGPHTIIPGRSICAIRSKARNLGLSMDRTLAGYTNVDLETIGPTQWSYFAGLIDGEGSIYISQTGNRTAAGLQKNFGLYVTITNTSRPLIDWLISTFGGTEKEAAKSPRRRRKWVWAICQHRAGPYLRNALPYLIIKKKQALLAIQFLEERAKRRINSPVTSEDVVLWLSFKERISLLNQGNGPKPGPTSTR